MTHEGGPGAVPTPLDQAPEQIDIRENGPDPRRDWGKGLGHDVLGALVEVVDGGNADVGENAFPVSGTGRLESMDWYNSL